MRDELVELMNRLIEKRNNLPEDEKENAATELYNELIESYAAQLKSELNKIGEDDLDYVAPATLEDDIVEDRLPFYDVRFLAFLAMLDPNQTNDDVWGAMDEIAWFVKSDITERALR